MKLSTKVIEQIDKYSSIVNPNLKENILQNIWIWNLLWDKISDSNEKDLNIDEILEKYSLWERVYKTQTIFNFFVEGSIILFSTWFIAPMSWGWETIIFKYENNDLIKVWEEGVWMW